MKVISILTPCYNEEANVEELYRRVRAAMARVGKYPYEHIFIDNHSRDNTVAVLKSLAAVDHNVRIIVNSRNFGQVRSPMHALMETKGDAVIGLAADMQDPPEMIEEMIAKWEDRLFDGSLHQENQPGKSARVSCAYSLLPVGAAPFVTRNLREFHRLRPV